MSLWTRLSEIVARLPLAETVGSMIDRAGTVIRETLGADARRQVSFTISMIALTAKMAKADGVVTADEVAVVKKLFDVPEEERRNVARLFNLAKEDVAGFESYANKIRRLHAEDPDLLEDILDGLFLVAEADGVVHERELAFLETVAEVFHLSPQVFSQIEARHVRPDARNPYAVLGIPQGSTREDARRAYRKLVGENHPDRLMARGVPPECIRLATDRMARLNEAYETIEKELVAG
ncbi:TerB family tellurite resistance protein [Chthonobacter albigriseus]|uniref:TerB family tellurite resistance protein n=1 Tax=Chthonobacter albigriseus TaxID=1683161 RepID=UPI0015EE6DDF|nr:DnaJ family molecular chaperone [Chthonobacter albigriseus]